MSESISVRIAKLPDILTSRELRPLLESMLTDIAALQAGLNAHTHGGVTTGADTSGAANAGTVTSLNTKA